jgi:hypothetical protein
MGNCSAYAMGDARSVIAVYDVAKAAIDAKLRSLYAAGQRKLSLVLWHFFNQYSYAPPQTTYLNTYCEMVVADGILTSKHQANLSALIATIKTIGFTQINFRFAPVDISNPMSWNSCRCRIKRSDENSHAGHKQCVISHPCGRSTRQRRLNGCAVSRAGAPTCRRPSWPATGDGSDSAQAGA